MGLGLALGVGDGLAEGVGELLGLAEGLTLAVAIGVALDEGLGLSVVVGVTLMDGLASGVGDAMVRQSHGVVWLLNENVPLSWNVPPEEKHAKSWRAAMAHCLSTSILGCVLTRMVSATVVIRMAPPNRRMYSKVP